MLFKISIAIFLANQFLQYFGIGNYFTVCFLDDLLFFPVAYSLIQYYFKLIKKNFSISIEFAIIGIIFTSFTFEILFPIISKKHTAEIYDIVFYTLGAVIFMLFGKQKPDRKLCANKEKTEPNKI